MDLPEALLAVAGRRSAQHTRGAPRGSDPALKGGLQVAEEPEEAEVSTVESERSLAF